MFCRINTLTKAMINCANDISDFIDGICRLIDDLKIPKKLKDVGISHNDIPKLAEDAMKQERLLINNPQEIEYKNAVNIYEAAL